MRYSIPGDYCIVEADGTLTLLGRGSVCINTAGEKVYPEEVEEVLKTHPDDRGRPGRRRAGRKVGPDGHGGDTAAPRSTKRCARTCVSTWRDTKRRSGFAVPMRASNGKADYKGAPEFAKKQLGIA